MLAIETPIIMSKKILLYAGIALLLFQLYRPAKNQSGENTKNLFSKYPTSENVKKTLSAACLDCHSNNTIYPWYSNFQPIASWLNGHVKGGKKKLNFDAFLSSKISTQNHKFEEIIESIEEGFMPLKSYTWTHKDAKLNDVQKQEIIAWAKSCMTQLASEYPADSLILKRNK
jgi:hypothetical protein